MLNYFLIVIYRSYILPGIARIHFHKSVLTTTTPPPLPKEKKPQKPRTRSVRGPTSPGLKAAPDARP